MAEIDNHWQALTTADKRGHTQHQAADEIGVTETAFGRWERGIARPQPLSAEALLDYLLREEGK